MDSLPLVRRTMTLGAIAGAGLASYAAWEARQYTLRHVTVPLLPAGHAPLKVLHLSDIHMAPDQRAKQEWLRGLAALEPDLVDQHRRQPRPPPVRPGGRRRARRAARPCRASTSSGPTTTTPPGMRNPLLYLLPDTGKRNTKTPQLPWPDLKERFGAAGWLDLTNGFGRLTVKGTTIAFAGVDDPHLKYDDLPRVAGPADPEADVRLAITHAPYLRVLDQFAADGYDAIIAGHTHGGQVCLPTLDGRGRALTTNCDLEPARARGLHRHPADSVPGDAGSSWLHVSAGLGTNPYVRFRVACRPEATLLTLT